MKKIYFTGHNNFGNRGCEALVRSNIMLLRERFPNAEFFVPSFDPARDAKQWPGYQNDGIHFVDDIPLPSLHKWWGRFANRFSPFKQFDWPDFDIPEKFSKELLQADALLSIGGDNYSLDYGLVSLFYFIGIGEWIKKNGKVAALWGASVGPFDKEPAYLPQIIRHLNNLDMVSVRENNSYEYLKRSGVTSNLIQVADSAFAMQPEEFEIESFWPSSNRQVLGFNISPLIEKYRVSGEPTGALRAEAAKFIRHAVNYLGLHVLLVPHVAPLNGSEFNNDEIYLAKLFAEVADLAPNISIAPSGLNAPQLKYMISQCSYFIGARTHATIAAFSTAVPTVSIAYSVKAKGINLGLFGHSDYVLETPAVSNESLKIYMDKLVKDDASIRHTLKQKSIEFKNMARLGVSRLAQRLT